MGLVKKSHRKVGHDLHIELDTVAANVDLQELLDNLQATKVTVRRHAVKALRHHKIGQCALIEHLNQETSSLVTEAVFDSLIYQCENGQSIERIIAKVVEVMRSADAPTRNSSIVFLSSYAQAMAAHIPALLADTSSDIQLYALDILRGMSHPQTSVWLAGMLQQDLHVNVYISLLERIADYQVVELVDQIRSVSSGYADEPLVTFATKLTIARLGGDNELH